METGGRGADEMTGNECFRAGFKKYMSVLN
jgi:hypothetical protein